MGGYDRAAAFPVVHAAGCVRADSFQGTLWFVLFSLVACAEVALQVQEAEKRPDAVKKMKSMLKATRAYIDELKANRTWLTTNDTAPSLKLLNSTET